MGPDLIGNQSDEEAGCSKRRAKDGEPREVSLENLQVHQKNGFGYEDDRETRCSSSRVKDGEPGEDLVGNQYDEEAGCSRTRAKDGEPREGPVLYQDNEEIKWSNIISTDGEPHEGRRGNQRFQQHATESGAWRISLEKKIESFRMRITHPNKQKYQRTFRCFKIRSLARGPWSVRYRGRFPRSGRNLNGISSAEVFSWMESSSPFGSCCIGLSSHGKPTELNLKNDEQGVHEVREQHEGHEHPGHNIKPFVFTLAACIAWFFLFVVVIVLAILLQQRKCASCGVIMRLQPCPEDWLYNGRKCYYFSKKREHWDDSQLFCSFYNASLALINSQEELNFLMELTCEHHMWIGLRRREDAFEWANGTTCNQTMCAISDFGECVYIEDGAVRVSGCSLIRPYICTREPHI
ncbi:uncharacterized protein LOC144828299 [Lissotriton helveticus]